MTSFPALKLSKYLKELAYMNLFSVKYGAFVRVFPRQGAVFIASKADIECGEQG
jgi:hypothetical protein